MADPPARRRRRPRSPTAPTADPLANLSKLPPGLTAKQARFVEEFCVDFNATQAAIRAGYAQGSAFVSASRLRAHPAVAAAIDVARAALRTRCDASADRWLLEVLAISYGDPDAKTADGKPATRLTFGEKVRALELQGRALGFLKEQLEVRGSEGGPIKIVHQAIP
jgi:phage terminase small subunit